MTMPDRIQRLREAARSRHERTLRRAEAALRALAHRGDPVTVHDAARLAGVSRSWLYQQPQLLAEINRLRELPPSSRGPRARASQRATVDSLRQQLHAYREEITRLRAENKALTEQLARYLGATRATATTSRH
jgi:Family of unknown function (DUF6262)